MGKFPHEYGEEVYRDPKALYLALVDTLRRQFDVMMPCKVVDYGREDRVYSGRGGHYVWVKPLVKFIRAYENDGDSIEKIRCTAWRFSAGGFVIDMPIHVGDTGWVISADRATGLVKTRCPPKDDSGVEPMPQAPDDRGRTHQFNDGLFIPDMWGALDLYHERTEDLFEQKNEVYSPGEDRLTIQSKDGKSRISLGCVAGNYTICVNADVAVNVVTDKANVTAVTAANLKTKTVNVTAAETVNVTAGAEVNVTTPKVNVSGDLNVGGNVTIQKDLVTAAVASYNRHRHGGVTAGSGTSGEPVKVQNQA